MLSLITSASELTFSSRTLLSGFGCDYLRGLLAPGLRPDFSTRSSGFFGTGGVAEIF